MSEPPADPPESVVYLDVDDALEVFGAIIGGTATQAAGQLCDRTSRNLRQLESDARDYDNALQMSNS